MRDDSLENIDHVDLQELDIRLSGVGEDYKQRARANGGSLCAGIYTGPMTMSQTLARGRTPVTPQTKLPRETRVVAAPGTYYAQHREVIKARRRERYNRQHGKALTPPVFNGRLSEETVA